MERNCLRSALQHISERMSKAGIILDISLLSVKIFLMRLGKIPIYPIGSRSFAQSQGSGSERFLDEKRASWLSFFCLDASDEPKPGPL